MTAENYNKSTCKGEVDLNWVFKYLKDGVYPPKLNFTEKRMVRKRAERFCYLNGELFYLGTLNDQSLGKRTRKVLLTHEERTEKVQQWHVNTDGSHLGLERTADAIVEHYHWNGIYKFIKEFIRKCPVCQARHPKMFPPSSSTVKDDLEGIQSGYSDVQKQGSSNLQKLDVGCVEEIYGDTEIGDGDSDDDLNESNTFWQKVDLRLLGPYKFATSSRYILVGVDGHSHWIEAFVLDPVSPSTVACSLLQMICRYGQMGRLDIDTHDFQLEAALKGALKILKQDSEMDIPLQKSSLHSTDDVFSEAQKLIENFIKKNPKNWPENIDVCLLPLRLSNRSSTANSASIATRSRESGMDTTNVVQMPSSKVRAVEALLSLDTGKDTQMSTPQAPSSNTSVRGIITRSRTGNVKPKILDVDVFETTISKRRYSARHGENQMIKKIKVEPMKEGIHIGRERESVTKPVHTPNDGASDSESHHTDIVASPKKSVELDTYYYAIKNYVEGNGYPENASHSFKRLIKDQAKSYQVKDGTLYHSVGTKGALKRIVMDKRERMNFLTQAHLKSTCKSHMVSLLEDYHWKGKLIDCEAFILACPHCDKQDQKVPKDSLLNFTEAKKQLQFDRLDNYQEISNYIIYDLFSNGDTPERLDVFKQQFRNFRVENKELLYVLGNKKCRVITSGRDRQKAIAEAHFKKGTHSDMTTTFNKLSESVFWFGMKLDVMIYIDYCCTSENKFLLDRYFIFREYHMTEKIPIENTSEDNYSDTRDSQDVGKVHDLLELSDNEERDISVSPTKLNNIFVSTIKHTGDDNQSKADLLTPPQMVNATGDAALMTVTDTPQHMITDGVEVIEEVVGASLEQVVRPVDGQSTIIITQDGQIQTIVVSQTDGTAVTNSDAVTMAAVKSILQDTGGMSEVTVDKGIAIKSEIENAMSATDVKLEEIMSAESGESTAEAGTTTDNVIDEDGESDDWLYDTDDDDGEDAGEIYECIETKDDGSLVIGIEERDPDGKRVITPRQHFKCSQCNKIFFGPIKFKMHMYKHTGQKPFPCNQCNKKYTNKKSLVIHQRTHSGELPYLCSLCGKRCPSKISLKSHLKCHDGQGGGFPATCDVCHRVFTRKHLMERHKQFKHTNAQTEFKCSECSKVFGHQRSLKRHYMSMHLGIKNHICGLCGKAFYRKEYLTGHLIQHGGTAAEGLVRRQRPSTYKPRPSVFSQTEYDCRDKKYEDIEEGEISEDADHPHIEQVQQIILHQDENGELRLVDMATEQAVKRMLDTQGLNREAGETMVVHIEEPGGSPQIIHVENTEEQVMEVPIEEHGYVEYQQGQTTEYVISAATQVSSGDTQYMYTNATGEVHIEGNQELIYEQPVVQYEVECVGDIGDEEALSAINLLAQASAQQYENVISQI